MNVIVAENERRYGDHSPHPEIQTYRVRHIYRHYASVAFCFHRRGIIYWNNNTHIAFHTWANVSVEYLRMIFKICQYLSKVFPHKRKVTLLL